MPVASPTRWPGCWDEHIVPLLTQTPGLRPITVLEQMQLLCPDRDLNPARRRLERRMRM